MKKFSFLFVSVIIFTGLVIFQTNAGANEDATSVVDETISAAETPTRTGTGVGNRTFRGASATFITSNVRIELVETDNIETAQTFYRIGSGEEQEYSEPFTIEEEGTHTITYYSIDQLGNREAPKVFTVVVDNTPPDVTLNITAPFVITDGVVFASEFINYQYSIHATDNSSGLASVHYSIGDEDTDLKHYLKPFSVNSRVPVKINVFAEDRVGNFTSLYATNIYDENGVLIASSADEINIIIDNTPPEVTITPSREFFMKGDLQVASRDYKFTINATDDESGVRAIFYRLNNDPNFILYTGQEISFSTNGMQRIEAIAVDRVGNTSVGTALEFYVDTLPSTTELRFVAD